MNKKLILMSFGTGLLLLNSINSVNAAAAAATRSDDAPVQSQEAQIWADLTNELYQITQKGAQELNVPLEKPIELINETLNKPDRSLKSQSGDPAVPSVLNISSSDNLQPKKGLRHFFRLKII